MILEIISKIFGKLIPKYIYYKNYFFRRQNILWGSIKKLLGARINSWSRNNEFIKFNWRS